MPRGGARDGAGRKKGGKNKRKFEAPSPDGETALEYLHRLMRDPNIDPIRRDWAARMAVRYEQKAAAGAAPAGPRPGKKQAADEAAVTASAETDWADLVPGSKPN